MSRTKKKSLKHRADVAREHTSRYTSILLGFKAQTPPLPIPRVIYKQNTPRIEARQRCRELATLAVQNFPKLCAKVHLSTVHEAVRFDLEHIADIKAKLGLKSDQFLLYWSDGSYRGGFLGAGVATGVQRDSDVEYFTSQCALGFETGDSEDAELFAIAVALGLAKKHIKRQDAHEIKLVRVFTDSQACLHGLQNRNSRTFGPLLVAKTALEGIYERSQWLYDRCVAVELQWVKGHSKSMANRMADEVAGQIVEDQIKADINSADVQSKNIRRPHRTTADVPSVIKDLGHLSGDGSAAVSSPSPTGSHKGEVGRRQGEDGTEEHG